jgi:hypothetical protein
MPPKLLKVAPKKTLNAAFLKLRPLRSEMDLFKSNLIRLLDHINESESEENQKNHVRDFLLNTYYTQKHEVNTKGRQDLVIHTDVHNASPVGVIIETKRPANKSEWISADKPNNKALHELVLYFLRERVDGNNLDIRHLVATNVYEWYIFDASVFEKLFYQNKKFVRDYEAWRDGQKVTKDTHLFYNEIARPHIDSLTEEIPVAFFDLREYDTELRNADKADDKKLIALQKLLSPYHLLKQAFANDSNSLDKRFYSELLHIIGLTETKEGGKKLIGRHKTGERLSGTILEDAIIQIESLDKLSRIDKPGQYGADKEERLFNIALELSITWINRILFLKLLEGQLVSYHQTDANYLFLNKKTIREYDDLNTLFFQVLAKKHEDRHDDVRSAFVRVPYLNSSLFEPTELEHNTIFISNLKDDKTIPVYAQTVLKDSSGKKRSGQMTTLEYLFEFLNAYDFSSEGSEDIQEDNKTLINASVLGLIFEKINGYKDGSFFTPGFITMYMCRETIRRAVVQKFNETKSWSCTDLTELYNKIEDRTEANDIVNKLRICDPAVGSGHFLVSALNEIIAIKGELGILQDESGRRLKDYAVEVINDELIIKDENGDLFAYNPKNAESQRIQKTLFVEKQTIIENCLFGVDINPNSVKICRLRLWIELLKNAYYKKENELETLPNIDINIKCGNSLVSRFGLDADVRDVLKKKWTIDTYQNAVSGYKNAENKEEKREFERLINEIKGDFRTEIGQKDPLFLKRNKMAGELFNLSQQTLFPRSEKEQAEVDKKINKLQDDITKIEADIESIKANKIYENAFEWRFEFPEVLNEEGDFVGFDVVIGNPPYIRQEEFSDLKPYLKTRFEIYHPIADLLTYFVELGWNILKQNGTFQFIISNKFTRADYGKVMRQFLLEKTILTHFYDFSGVPVFDEATVDAAILGFVKKIFYDNKLTYLNINKEDFEVNSFYEYEQLNKREIVQNSLNDLPWAFQSELVNSLKNKVESQGVQLKTWDILINRGVLTGLNEAFVVNTEVKEKLIASDPNNAKLIKPMVRGRDIQKYQLEFADLWLIGTHNGFENEKPIDISEFPTLKPHFDQFEPALSKRYDKGVTPYNLRHCVYWQDFQKPKILYPEMTKFLNFAYDTSGYYGNNKIFILTGEQIEWLTCFFNSKLWAYCFRDNFPELLGGTRELRKVFFEKMPVKKLTEEEQIPFKKILTEIKSLKSQDPSADTTSLEAEIDRMVYDLYGLTEEERKIVEGDN